MRNMSQDDFEKNNETRNDPKKTVNIDTEPKNSLIKLNESHLKELEPLVTQILSFEENSCKALTVIDKKIFAGKLGSLEALEKSTRMILKIIEESIRHKILDVDATKYLREIENGYLDLDQEMRDVSNVSVVTQGLLINDIDVRVDNLLKSERSYIRSLEEELREKEETIKQIRMLLEQHHG